MSPLRGKDVIKKEIMPPIAETSARREVTQRYKSHQITIKPVLIDFQEKLDTSVIRSIEFDSIFDTY